MSKAQQERIKLFAGDLNTIGAGMIVTGIVAPIAAVIINPNLSARPMVYFGIASFLLSLGLHAFAQAVLGERPMTPLEIFAIFVMPGLTLAMAAAGYCIVRVTSQAKRPNPKKTDATTTLSPEFS